MRMRQNRDWHFDNPRGLADCDQVEAGLGRSPSKDRFVGTRRRARPGPIARRAGRGDLADIGYRLAGALSPLGRKPEQTRLGARPSIGVGAQGEAKRRRAAALQNGLASTGREGPVFPPEPRSRCRGREGREGWSTCPGHCLENGATGCQPEANQRRAAGPLPEQTRFRPGNGCRPEASLRPQVPVSQPLRGSTTARHYLFTVVPRRPS